MNDGSHMWGQFIKKQEAENMMLLIPFRGGFPSNDPKVLKW
jgi:hypothetical protein